MIAGVYKDRGEKTPEQRYSTWGWVETSLTYNLLSKEIFKHNKRPDLQELVFKATHVEIAQPASDIVKVIIWSGEGNERVMAWGENLSRDKGDFSCGAEGLELRSRREWLILLFSNLLALESRTLNLSEDGSLVMKLKNMAFGNHTLVPIPGIINNRWIRWTPMPSGANPEEAAR
jgi:hypothetical protein